MNNNNYPLPSNENLKKYQEDQITEDIVRTFGSDLPSIRKIIDMHRSEYMHFINYSHRGFGDELTHAYQFFMPYLIDEVLDAETPEQAIQILSEHPRMLSVQLGLPYEENGEMIESQTLLMYAIRNNKLELFNYIIDQPSVDLNRLEYGLAPIHVITFKNNIEMLRSLLSKPGINVNIQDLEGRRTALHYASSSEFVQELLSVPDIDPNIQDVDGNTALHVAVFRNNVDKVKLLLAHPRVQTDITNMDGDDPLQTIAGTYEYEYIYKLFQERAKLIRQAAWNRRKHAVMAMHFHNNENNSRKRTQRRRKNKRRTQRRRNRK